MMSRNVVYTLLDVSFKFKRFLVKYWLTAWNNHNCIYVKMQINVLLNVQFAYNYNILSFQSVPCDLAEKEFWRLVGSADEEV